MPFVTAEMVERQRDLNRETRAVIAEHEAEMSQFDEFGFARFDDEECADAQAHEDALEAEHEAYGASSWA